MGQQLPDGTDQNLDAVALEIIYAGTYFFSGLCQKKRTISFTKYKKCNKNPKYI
jgi:hypothetical protein